MELHFYYGEKMFLSFSLFRDPSREQMLLDNSYSSICWWTGKPGVYKSIP